MPLTIGELARQAGVTLATVRHYERVGIVPAPPRAGNGYRMYPEQEVPRIFAVRRAQSLGFTLDEILDLFRLAEPPFTDADLDRAAAITRGVLDRIERERSQLALVAGGLGRFLERCESRNFDECPVLESLQDCCDVHGLPNGTKPSQ